MTRSTKIRLLAIGALLAAGCHAFDDSHDLDVDSIDQNQLTKNGVLFEAYKFNAISTNPAGIPLLINHSLPDAFGVSAFQELIDDPYAFQVMEYLVGCALEPQQSVSWVSPVYQTQLTLDGEIGVCPDWEFGAPGQRCRELVSACLLARFNHFGTTVDLSLRGVTADNRSLGVEPGFNVPEGAFYGDMFDANALNRRLTVSVQSTGHSLEVIYHYDTGDTTEGIQDISIYTVDPTLSMSANLANRDAAHTSFMTSHAYGGVVYQQMSSCSHPSWTQASGYAYDRVCATFGQWEHCAADWAGYCGKPKAALAGVPIDRCSVPDNGIAQGDGDFDDCDDAGGGLWQNPITVYLE